MIQWKKRLAAWVVAGAVILSGMSPVPGQMTANAAEGGNAEFKKKGNEITIGNDYITRTFDISGGTVKTTKIDNKRADLTFSPADGSEEFVIKLKNGSEIKTSEMQLEGDVVEEDTDDGILVKFPFEAYTVSDANWDITMNVSMEHGKHYMRKFLEIAVDNKKVAIDYIDLEHMNVANVPKENQWTIDMSRQLSGYEIPSYIMLLGEPVYIDAMFFGCEFPATATEIRDNNAYMRYYTGKDFERLNKDNQLTLEGTYVTWPTVAGAAREMNMNVIQSDFYEYIRDISTKTDFRTQYNSWYDNEKSIDDKNIAEIFTRTEKELAETGVQPLDSYVVDDGWINYNDSYVLNASECGITMNKTGFWEFNSKFPQGFGPASELAQSFGSHFGVWLGPRGGYGYQGSLAGLIERSGFGARNAQSGDIDVGDRRYIRKLTEYFCFMQDAFKVNYWKLDGFAKAACQNDSHEHMIGGANDMYYYSDLWEGWTDLFDAVRANAEKNGIDNLWLNLTCYVTPTPWLLQWANSIWIQNSADVGQTASNPSVAQDSQADRYLSYRDGRYFDFVNNGQYQFPLANIFNHDPVYGKKVSLFGNNFNMTDEEFKTCLYMMATRGMAFWEMLYSPSKLDDGQKWEINAEALLWARENYHILRNAKLLGTTPATGGSASTGEATGNTYGFSCWDGEEGIISMRNPGVKEKTLEFKLDRTIGAAESLEGMTLYRTTVLDHNTTDDRENYDTLHYGETVSVTLQPGEATIWQLSTKRDTTPAKVELIKTLEEENSVKVKVTFDERIQSAGVTSTEGTTALTLDGRSVVVTLDSAPADGEEISFTLNGVEDLSGNTDAYNVKTTYHQDGVVAKASQEGDLRLASSVKFVEDEKLGHTFELAKAYKLRDGAYTGATEFSVSAYIKTEGKDASLIKQGSEYSLSLDADGKLVFTVGDQSVTSKQKVNDGEWRHVAGVRERNGMLKVYVDGASDGGLYVPEFKDIKSDTVEVGERNLHVEMSSVTVRNRTLALLEIEECGQTAESMAETVKHKVIFQTNGGNEIDTLKVAEGAEWELPENPVREGYKFAGWCTDPNCADEDLLVNKPETLSADLYLYAKWTKIHKVTVYTYGVLGDETVEVEVEEGTAIEGLDKLTRPGAKLLGWYTDYDMTQEFDTATLIDRDNIVLYPKYEVDKEISQSWESLEGEIAEMEKLAEGDYTEESWSQFEQALLSAQSAAKNAETKTELDTAMKALQRAYGKLEKKEPATPDVPTPGTPSTPGVPTPGTPGGATKLATPAVTVKSTWKGVQVNWNAVAGAASYTVSRNGKIMNTVTATSWLDEKPLGGKVNTYQVTANGDGTKTLTGAPGSTATGKLPKAAAKLKAKKSGKKVTLSWKKVKKASYVVLRATKKNGPYKKIKALKKNTYVDKKAKGKNAYYKVVVKSGKLYAPASKAKRVKL